ncbi:hypothetical protein BJ138DRAFT_1017074 [Hygrophoropsis aurantiaca]|uniref:Uncharacterized protein n=1 Tax=Hygrophoropsis aurantiaca TaxID=72124 RepID=A0ACB7ZXV6_9AGAM|nr:hypothetical protein BJ138DRAFT_1017074 [Hygrophoropsis aurantiaca]
MYEHNAALIRSHLGQGHEEPATLKISCPPDHYLRLLEEAVFPSGETSICVSYDSYRSILRIQLYTDCIHDAPLTFILRTIYDSPIAPARKSFHIFAGTTDFSGFLPPYEYSIKQPDIAICPGSHHWPSLVVESGLNEDYEDLVADARLWLLGGRADNSAEPECRGQVNVVILFIFIERTRRNFDEQSTPACQSTGERVSCEGSAR